MRFYLNTLTLHEIKVDVKDNKNHFHAPLLLCTVYTVHVSTIRVIRSFLSFTSTNRTKTK
jgi:hypothetical protein